MNSEYRGRRLHLTILLLLLVAFLGLTNSYGHGDIQPLPDDPNAPVSPPDAQPSLSPSLQEEFLNQPLRQALGGPLLSPRPSTSSNFAMEALLGGQDNSRLLIAVSLREEFSDNFDQESDNPQRESRTTLTLGTRYRALGKGRYLSLANTLDANYQAGNRILNVGFANLDLEAGYEFPRLSLAFRDTFVRDDSLEEASETGASRERTTFWRNTFAPRVRFQLSRFAELELAYTNTLIGADAEAGGQDKSVTDQIKATYQQQLTRTVRGRFSYTFARSDDNTSDPAYDFTIAADAAYDLTRLISFSLRTSWSYSNRAPEDTDSLRYGGDLSVRYRLLPELSLVIGIGVSRFDDEEGDPELLLTWQLGLNGVLEIVPGTRLSLASSQNIINTQGEVEEEGIVRRLTFRAQLEQDITRFIRLQLHADSTFTETLEGDQADESGNDRKEFFWRTGANLSYQLTRTWSLTLQYEHRRRDSNRIMYPEIWTSN